MKRSLVVLITVALVVIGLYFLYSGTQKGKEELNKQKAEELVAGFAEVQLIQQFRQQFQTAENCSFEDYFLALNKVYASEGLNESFSQELKRALEKKYPEIQSCAPTVEKAVEKKEKGVWWFSYYFVFPAECRAPSRYDKPVLVVEANLLQNASIAVTGNTVSEENRRASEQLLKLTGNCVGPFLATSNAGLSGEQP
jgi:hypothetical protein